MSPLIMLLTLMAAGGWSADQPTEPAGPPPVSAALASRLTALDPADPDAYFLLAEEVADVADEPHKVQLAQTLYVLAFELDRRRGVLTEIAPGACLGLARIERLEHDRVWLVALAGAIDARYARPDWIVPAAASPSEEVAYRAATLIGNARSGEGLAARRLLEDPAVVALLTEYERALGTSGGTGALFRIRRAAQDWPCRECENRRVVTRQGPSGPENRLCPFCHGNPGPILSNKDMIAQLRFEAGLLSGIQRSWAAQIAVDLGAPLRDPDPSQLAPTYNVEPSRPYWRNGAWIARPAP